MLASNSLRRLALKRPDKSKRRIKDDSSARFRINMDKNDCIFKFIEIPFGIMAYDLKFGKIRRFHGNQFDDWRTCFISPEVKPRRNRIGFL